jgi:hypothetical protein
MFKRKNIIYTTLLALGFTAFLRHDAAAQVSQSNFDDSFATELRNDTNPLRNDATTHEYAPPYNGVTYSINPLCERDYTLKDSMNLGAVHRILDDVLWHVLETTPDTQKIVFIMGEYHSVTTTILPQGLLLSSLVAGRDSFPNDPARQFIFSYELPYNILKDYAERGYDLPILDSALENLYHPDSLQAYDPHGHLSMHEIMASNLYPYPNTINALFNYVIQNNISAVFSDAARKNLGTCVDFKDSVALSYAKNIFNLSGLDTARVYTSHEYSPDSTYTTGVELRNFVMPHHSITHAKKQDARIIVQQCGQTHTGGYIKQMDKKTVVFPYKTSLAKIYNDAGFRVVNIFLQTIDESHSDIQALYPPEIWTNNDNIIIRNLNYAGVWEYFDDYLQDIENAYSYDGKPFPLEINPQLPDPDSVRQEIQDVIEALTPDHE